MKNKILIFILLIMIFPRYGMSEPLSWMHAQFEKANNLYHAQQYDQAKELYLQILDAGLISAELEYNLANTYYQLDQFGYAIKYYLRACKIDPRNKEIRLNYHLAYDKIQNDYPVQDSLWKIFWHKPLDLFNQWELLDMIFVLYLILWILIYFISIRKKYNWISLAVGISLIFFYLAVSYAKDVYLLDKNPTGIMLEDHLAYNIPRVENIEKFKLYEGNQFKIMDQQYDWYQIQLENGLIGWVEQDSVVLLDL